NHDADESDLDGDSPLYDASSITVNGVYELIGEDNDPASRISYHQVSAGTASVGEDEVYEVEDNGSVMRFTVYSPTY
ncbi:MAG TPA: hypothetical protein DHN33_03270, partial [Eubacteriaceae bacterium]|nr:hypothetical protein [Eubacteriaceae bacterium]